MYQFPRDVEVFKTLAKHKRVSGVVILIAATLAMFVAFYIGDLPGEPRFANRTLTQWLDLYSQPYGPNYKLNLDRSKLAVRAIGTNAIPYLVEKLQTRNSPFFDRVAIFMRRYPLLRHRAL